jgi:hypothetical protein
VYWSMVKPKNGSRFAVFTERCFPIHLLFRSATTPTRRIWVGVLTITSICLFAVGVDDATRDEYLQARHEAISKLMAEKMDNLRVGYRAWYDGLSTDEHDTWRKNISDGMKEYHANMTDEQRETCKQPDHPPPVSNKSPPLLNVTRGVHRTACIG